MIKPNRVVNFDLKVGAITPGYNDEFIIATNDGAIYKYNNGEKKLILTVYVLAFNKQLIVSRNFIVLSEGVTTIIDIQRKYMNVFMENKYRSRCICISHDESVIVAAYDNFCHVWNVSTTDKHLTYRNHIGMINCLAISNTDVFSGGDDKIIHKWNFQTGNLIATSAQLKSAICTMNISKNVLAVSLEENVCIFNLNLVCLYTIRIQKIQNLIFSPDGALLMMRSQKTLIIWDALKKRKITELDNDIDRYSSMCNTMCFSNDGRNFAAIQREKTIVIYDNIALEVFILQNNCAEHVKTVKSFFHALLDAFHPLFPFNNSDYDNYFLMRIITIILNK